LVGAKPRSNKNPLIIIGDKIQPKPYLVALIKRLGAENTLLDAEHQIRYVRCHDSVEVAQALRRHPETVKLILLGPGLRGNAVTVARMFSAKARIVIVIDPRLNLLGTDLESHRQTQKNLEDLGVRIVLVNNATDEFFEPLVNDYVLSGSPPDIDLKNMSPEDRAAAIDRRLDAVNKFPSMSETQRRLARLDDQAPPKKWAEIIEPDLTTRTVILRLLNSARYGFRYRVETVEQAVVLAGPRTIREIVTACQVRQLFKQTSEANIEQFWRHSLAAGFFAKLFTLPVDPAAQTTQQKTEFERFQLEPEQIQVLQGQGLWDKFTLDETEDIFTAGLLHDIGKITLLMCLEDSLSLITAVISSEVQEQKQQDRLWAGSVIGIERLLMKDLDHQFIGNRLAVRWDLPHSIQQVIAHHHDIQPQSPDLLKLVALANLAASALFPYPATDKQHPFPQLFARLDKAVKEKAGKSPETVVAEAIGQTIFTDLVDVMNRMAIPATLWEIIDFSSFFKTSYLLAPKIRSAAAAFMQQTG
jgi:HD-like signal output (HDOD) protein